MRAVAGAIEGLAPQAPAAAGGAGPDERLRLDWQPYRFRLPRALVTAHGALSERRGWLLRLRGGHGLGWGEAVAGPGEEAKLAAALTPLQGAWSRQALETQLPTLAAPLRFALGAALAELAGDPIAAEGAWLAAPPSAWLLPAGEAALPALEACLAQLEPTVVAAPSPLPLTVKWKVAVGDDVQERQILERLLERLPATARLRLDANGGWDRPTAAAWARRLAAEPRLEWLEQPLDPTDGEGLLALALRLPVALDESLRQSLPPPDPWPGWQVRRPLLEGDPRPLLAALRQGQPRLMVSTALETGIGRRWLAHLAALQRLGPTPTAPGLAPGWRPCGALFTADPARVWRAAGGP